MVYLFTIYMYLTFYLFNLKLFIFLVSYKRDAMEKLRMSNDGATDVYLSNSRCVRNDDKPVDNNVLTGRLTVYAGPQHHQWHQQLLMHADEDVA